MALLPAAEALDRILAGVAPTPAERVAISAADGRVLAEDLAARMTQPPFAASAMDGYALRGADAATAGARLTVVGTSAAGRGLGRSLAPGEAARIFTGAPLPQGSDTVLIQENATRDGDTVVVVEPPTAGANVRTAGIDFREGDVLLRAGTVLGPHTATLAAAMGYGSVLARRRPRVAILATGDELVPPGEQPGPDQIVSSNAVGLAALVTRAGGEPIDLGLARDDAAEIAARAERARDTDVLVTIGGASVGDHDLVAPALAAIGMQLDFWKVAIRPGKPLIFGRLGDTRVLGLPGNPVSALVSAHVFLVPLVRALLGLPREAERRETARLTHPVEANGPRLHLMRATLAMDEAGVLAVTPVGSQDSSLLSALATADILIERAPDAPALPAGAIVPIRRFAMT